ncbi:hypothetical protein LTR17_009472 [Elasticomyces elasticus]|nr:hypothetical protein LTR17_009472 [Elasticomyces elasticus]
MTSEGQSQSEHALDKAPESSEGRAYVARKKVGGHKKCVVGDNVWLWYPDGTGPYPAEVVEVQFVTGTKLMKYRLEYKGQVLKHKENEWFTQDCVSKQ